MGYVYETTEDRVIDGDESHFGSIQESSLLLLHCNMLTTPLQTSSENGLLVAENIPIPVENNDDIKIYYIPNIVYSSIATEENREKLKSLINSRCLYLLSCDHEILIYRGSAHIATIHPEFDQITNGHSIKIDHSEIHSNYSEWTDFNNRQQPYILLGPQELKFINASVELFLVTSEERNRIILNIIERILDYFHQNHPRINQSNNGRIPYILKIIDQIIQVNPACRLENLLDPISIFRNAQNEGLSKDE